MGSRRPQRSALHRHVLAPDQPAPQRTARPTAHPAPGRPLELERLVDRLLAKYPAHRPDSADEVYDLIEEINDRDFGDTPPPSRGADVTSEVWLSPSEATDGAVIPMRMTAHENCPACTITGDETRVLDCAICRGEGRVASKRRTFSVRIPAGVRSGQKIRLRELGAAVLCSDLHSRESPCVRCYSVWPSFCP